MKNWFVIIALALLFPNSIILGFGQQPSMMILDTLVIHNPSEHDVLKLDVKFHLSSFDSDTLFLWGIGRHIDSWSNLIDALELGCRGWENACLQFIIEDGFGEMQRIKYFEPLSTYSSWTCEKRALRRRRLVDEETLRVYYKVFKTDEEVKKYDDNLSYMLAMTNPDTVFSVFPILSDHISTVELKPGRYKLYLYYSFLNPTNEKQNKQFYGTMISNKVDLIVEDRPTKWWEFWRRKSK